MPLSAGIIKSLGGPTLRSFTDEEKNSSLSKTQTRIDNARTRLDSLGYEAPERKDSLLVSVLKNLSRTGYAANNVVREFTDGSAGATPDKFDPFKAFGRGFSLDEEVIGKDIMEGIGLNGNTGIFGGENKIYNPSVAGMTGLALDILNPLDLLNWLSFGLGKTAIKGGSVGAEALTKTFGSKADDIVKAIGNLDDIKAGNVGELISKIGNSSNLKGDELNKLLKAMGEGIVETGSKAGDKISKVAKTRRMTLGLQNPLTLGRGQEFLKTEIPGTGAIGGAITSLGDAFKKSRIGNELGKLFSTKYTPSNLPDSVIIRNLTGNQLDNLIGDGVKISGDIPFNKEELMTIKNSLSQVKSMNGEATIKSIADATGFDTKDIMSLMENEVPFTFDIMDLYDSVRKYHPDIDPRQAFLQSVKLRKVMDDIYGDIPEELKAYFKGSVKLPNPTKTFSDTPIPFDEIDQMNPDSPMLSYVFDVKGVEVVVPIRTNADFNPGGLDNASKIIRALNSLDEKNLNAIRGQVKAMPGELGVIDGDTIRGYFHSNDIVIRQPQEVGELAETVPHEFGHSAMSNYQIDPEDYKARAMKDTFIDDYAKDNGPKEDWAVAVEWMKNRPDELQAKFPDRFNYIKKVMDENGMSADDLIQRISAQNDRTLKMDSIGNTSTQLDSVISQIDNYVSTNLISKSGQDAYKEFKGSMHELYENISLSKVEDFVQQVEGIFRHVPVGERKAIMDIASGLYDDAPRLSVDGEAALKAFTNWRQSVIKMYNEAQIPINEMEKYVPFIPERPLKRPESQMLNTIYGTGNATQAEDPLTNLFSRLDPNIKERTTKARTPSEVNKLLDKPWLTEDAAIAMATRGTRAIKTVELSKALDGLVSQYGRSYSEILEAGSREIPKHYKMYMIANENGMKTLKEVYDATGIAAKDIKSFFLPEEMANVYNMYSDLIMGNEKKSAIIKMFDKATNAYKKVAYLWNPGHIARDFEGNVFNNYLMGVVNPLDYVKSARLLSKPDSKVIVDGVEITVTELLDKARKVGLLDVGAANAESVTDVMGKLKSNKMNIAQKAGSKYSQLMKEGTRKADMYTRFTGLIHNLDKGMSFNEAATEVKKFLFDYFELTPFERKVMKRIIPFYTWMRKNIPLQVEQVMTNPRNYSRIESVMTATEGDAIDWSNRPRYVNDSGAVRLGESGDYISPNLPFNDLSRVPTNLDSLLQLISGVNPLIKAPIEMATNQQWFNGRPLEEYPNETREAPFAGILKLLGVSQEDIPRIDKRTLGYLFDQIPLARNLDVMSNPDNPRQLSRASSFIGGPAVYSKESVENSTVYELDRTLANFIKKLKDEGIDVPTVTELKKQPNKLIKIRDLLR